MRLLIYSRCYLCLMFIVLVGVIGYIILNGIFYEKKLKAIDNFYTVSEEMALIQQQYAYLVGFNWISTYSY